MRVLVTGATGFVGGRLARALVARGDEVTGLGRDAVKGAALAADGVRFVRADAGDREAIVAACAGQDAVVHCAGLSAPHAAYALHHAANVLGTENVVAGAQAAGARLVHISTSTVYFRAGHQFGLREDAPLPRPVTAYAATKREAEILVARAASALDAVILRPRAVFGPGDTQLVPRLLRAARLGFLPLFGKDPVVVDMTYVDNLVDAIVLCLDAPRRFRGEILNVTNGEPTPLADVLSRLFRGMRLELPVKALPWSLGYCLGAVGEAASAAFLRGREPTLTRFTVAQLAFSQTLDISAIRGLGYAPRVGLDAGIDQFAEWWRLRRE